MQSALGRTAFTSTDLLPLVPRTDLPDGLTPREAEIVTVVATGMTNPEIAQTLVLSSHTIQAHINRTFTKTGPRDRAAATRYARDHDLG